MTVDFEHELRQGSGPAARFGVWFGAVVDVVTNAAAVHWNIAKRDLLYSLRALRNSPGFTITALLLITIGIGANAAVFTLADFVLIRPLPFPHPERLVEVWEKHQGYSQMGCRRPTIATSRPRVRRSNPWAPTPISIPRTWLAWGNRCALMGHKSPATCSWRWGRPALIGRTFSEADDAAGAAGTVVLSYSLWQSGCRRHRRARQGHLHLTVNRTRSSV